MKSKLDMAREIINEVDLEMIELFKRRMAATQMVALYKIENNLPVLDSAREEIIINKNVANLGDKNLEEFYLIFFKGVLESSKNYQKELMANEKGL